MRITATLLSLTILSLLLACSGESSSRSVSVEEYAQLTCADDLPDDATWGDSVELLEETIETRKGITPPVELLDYHNAADAMSKKALEFAKSKPKGDTINPFEMMGEPELLTLGMALSAIEENLPSEIQDTLDSADCN